MSKNKMDQLEEIAKKMTDEQLIEAVVGEAITLFAQGVLGKRIRQSLSGDVPSPYQELVAFKREAVNRMSAVREFEKIHDERSHVLLERVIGERLNLFGRAFMEMYQPSNLTGREVPAGPWAEFAAGRLEMLDRMVECRRLKKK